MPDVILSGLAMFVDIIRQDAEVEGYFGQFLDITWDELREIDRVNGIATVLFERDGELHGGIAFIGGYPGTSLDGVRLSMLGEHRLGIR